MNIATTTSRKTRQRLGTRPLLAFIAAAAIAVSVAAGVTWRTNQGSKNLVSRPVTASVENRPFDQYHTLYIVGSSAQREFVEERQLQAANEREGAGISSTGISYSILQFRD